MKQELEIGTMQKALDYAYEKSINGLPGFETSAQLAQSYLDKNSNAIDAANSLVNWQIAKCATSGFVTNLGGLMTLPVAVPANLASVLYIQIRMIAAIAHIGGYDIKDDQVKTFVYLALVGQSLTDAAKDVGVKIATKAATSAIKNKIPGAILIKINQYVGFKLLTKAGTTGVLNLTKLVPFLGGIIGGTVDGITTNTIGSSAIDIFCNKKNDFEIYVDVQNNTNDTYNDDEIRCEKV